MDRWTYTRGLHEVGDGVWAWLQPNGSWGWSNAGLIADQGASLLVDTLFDLRLTSEMLAAMRRAAPAAERIDTVVNTHANGDHCWGNQLVGDAEIIASEAGAAEMIELPPERVASLVRASRMLGRLGAPGRGLAKAAGALGLNRVGHVGEAADFVTDIFGAFEFDGIELTPPTRTFTDRLRLQVGDTHVELIEVGPAHTTGDVVVHLPQHQVVFTGDILFVGGHPIAWAGPVSNWIAALDTILALEADVVVPGHGPITDRSGVLRLKEYLQTLQAEVSRCYEAGLSVQDAAREVALDAFGDLSESERLVVNVDTIYRELSGSDERLDPVEAFAEMARFRRDRGA